MSLAELGWQLTALVWGGVFAWLTYRFLNLQQLKLVQAKDLAELLESIQTYRALVSENAEAQAKHIAMVESEVVRLTGKVSSLEEIIRVTSKSARGPSLIGPYLGDRKRPV